jgi:S-DNA-T family DNA segregation ATPase FtsK/SpoIIIE
MAKAVARKAPAGFLPHGAAPMLRRLAHQTGGLLLIALGLAAVAAIVTYDARDPSFNTAASGAVANALGRGGAWGADALLQSLGLAAWLPAFAAMVWGARLVVAGTPPERWPLRVALLISGALLVDIGLARLPAAALAHLPGAMGGSASSVGGTAGRLLLGGLDEAARLVHVPIAAPILMIVATILGLVCLNFAIGLTGQGWLRIGRTAWAGSRIAGRGLGWAGAVSITSGARALAATRKLSERREPSLGESKSHELRVGEPLVEPGISIGVAVGDGDESDTTQVERVEPLVVPRAAPAQPGKRARDSRQKSLDLKGEFERPPLDLLTAPPVVSSRNAVIDEEALAQNARLLESVLDDFGVQGTILKVRPGPVVTLYELEPAAGTKTSRVIGLSDDIARQMSALSVRIATIPGRNVIGIELPNAKRETVYLRELLAAESFESAAASLTLMLGKDIGGQPIMVDLARMPHLLIAGTTGSGKSVAINTMILSLLYRLTPDQCRLVLIDPKMLELSVYDDIPHLLTPVVTEAPRAVAALKWTVREMEDRYRAMSQLGVRNIAGYNQRLAEARQKGEKLTRTVQTGFDEESGKPIYEEQGLDLKALPFIVVVVDEMADLMLVAGKDIEASVQRLAQMARAAGIHVIMATQRPSVDVITGTIKANFPTRISFQVTSKIDSRTILGEQGAEQLLGQGDMLYMAAGGRITRVHGPFVSDREVEEVTKHLRAQGAPAYIEGVAEVEEEEGPALPGADFSDEYYDMAVALVAREGKASTSFIQRHLQIGYNRAARIIEKMESEGVVSRANHMGKREVLVTHHGG